ncbi:MAG: hypothetical protein ABI823_04680 [Bryobacteraceae bacterium]
MTLLLLTFLLFAPPQDHDKCPMAGHSAVDKRGDQVMGFSHERTAHHFLLYKDGGAIQVGANDATDTESRDQIRQHLGHIAKMFSDGNFEAPMLIHAQTPPGVPVMKAKRDKIQYAFEENERGGQVRIRTTDAKALKAIHEFLRFQISDHHTGDQPKISE